MKHTFDPFQEIFNAAVEGVIVSNKAGKIILSNPSAASMFGYEMDELMSLTIEGLIPKGNKPKHKKLRHSYFDKPGPRQMGVGMDLQAMRKDGSIFPVEISLSHTVIGNEMAVVSFIIDITQRKIIESEIKREKETAQMYLDIAGAVFMVLDKNEDNSLTPEEIDYVPSFRLIKIKFK